MLKKIKQRASKAFFGFFVIIISFIFFPSAPLEAEDLLQNIEIETGQTAEVELSDGRILSEDNFRILDAVKDVAYTNEGTYVYRIYSEPRMLYVDNGEYRVRPGDWNLFSQTKEMQIKNVNKVGYSYSVPLDGETIVVKAGKYEVGKNFLSASEAGFTKSKKNTADLTLIENLYPSVDVEFTDRGRYRHREIIIKEKPENSDNSDVVFWEEYEIPKGTKVFNEKDKQIFGRQKIERETIFIETPNSSIFSIGSAIVYDSSSSDSKEFDVKQIVDVDYENNTLSIGLVVDGEYLSAKDRVYPVIVDPDYTACSGSLYGYDERVNCQVTDLSLRNLTSRTSGEFLKLGFIEDSLYGNRAYLPIFKFNVDYAWLSQQGELNNATLNLIYSHKDSDSTFFGSTNTVVRKVNRSWSSGSVRYSDLRGYLTTLGSRYISHFDSPVGFSWDITSAVSNWMAGGSNYGLLVEEVPTWDSGSWPSWNNIIYNFYDSNYGTDQYGVGHNSKSPYLMIEITPPAYPDLTYENVLINGQSGPVTVNLGDTLNVSLRVANHGQVANNSGPYRLDYYFNRDTPSYSSVARVGMDEFGSISPGSYSNENFSFVIDEGQYSPGTYYFSFFVDAFNQVDESNENNNTGYIAVTVIQPETHDVDINSVQFSNPNSYYQDEDRIYLDVQLQNNGNVNETVPYSIKIIDQTNNNEFNLTSLGASPTINAGQTIMASFSGVVPNSSLMSTSYRQFGAEVEINVSGDSDNDVKDSWDYVYVRRYSHGGGGGEPPANPDGDALSEPEEAEHGTDEEVVDQSPVYDIDNQESSRERDDTGGDPVNLRTGSFELTQTDISIPGRGQALDFVRVYNSKTDRNARFGQGWSFSYNQYYFQDPDTKQVIIYKGGTVASVFDTADGGLTFVTPLGENDKLYWDGDTLVFERFNGIKYLYSNQLTDNMGLLASIVDTNGNVTSLSYSDIRGIQLLTSVIDSSGRSIVLTYGDSLGEEWDKIKQMTYTTGGGETTTFTYAYDSNLNLTQVSKTRIYDGQTETEIDNFTFDGNNRIVTHTDPRGTVLRNVYDTDGRVLEQYETKMGDSETLIYDFSYSGSDPEAPGSNYCTVLKSYEDGVSYDSEKYCYNADHLRVYYLDKDSTATIETRNSLGLVTGLDQGGRVTTFVYDADRRKIKEILSDTSLWHTEIEYDYGAFNRVSEKRIKVWTVGSDYNTDPEQMKTTKYNIDPSNGNILDIEDPLGNKEYYTYDSYGNVLTYTDRENNLTTYVYDADGNYLLSESKTVTLPDGSTQNIVKSYEYDEYGNITKYTTPGDSIYNYSYDNRGNLRWEEDPDGNKKYYEYDIEDHRTAMIDELNRRTEYTYDTDIGASLTSVTRKSTQYSDIVNSNEYDKLGRLTKEIDPEGNETSLVYNDAGRVYQRIEPYKTTEYSYDDYGNVVEEVIFPTGSNSTNWQSKIGYIYDNRNSLLETRQYSDNVSYISTFNEYDGFGRVVKTTDANGNETDREYDLNNRLVRTVDVLDNTTEFVYDKNGNKIGEKNSRCLASGSFCNSDGYSNSYEYDEANRLIKTTNADDKVVVYYYNEDSQVEEMIDRQNLDDSNNNHVTTYQYDSLSRKSAECDAYSNCNNYFYDAVGNLTTSTDRMGRVTIYFYDDFDRVTEEIDAEGDIAAYTYDKNGNRTRIIYADDTQTDYTYDDADGLTVITDELTNTRQFTYDILNNKITETDKRGYVTSFSYDKLGRLVSETNPQSTATSYTYDDNGNRLTETIDTKQTSFSYDELNRITQITHPGDKTESFVYDSEGNIINETDGEAQTIVYTYDALNRPTNKALPGDINIIYTYDNWDNLNQLVDQSGTSTYIYDLENRQTNEQKSLNGLIGQTYNVTRTYQADGQLNTLTDAAGRVLTYNYNNRGLLNMVNYNSQALATYAYNAMSKPASLNYNNGTQTSYSYDDLNRLSVLEITNATSTSLFKHEYSYDAESNRTSLLENENRTINYVYDNLGQITQVDYPDVNGFSNQINFTYDKWGNRISLNTPYQTVNYTYAADSNELQSYSYNGGRLTVTNQYDGNGSLTQETYQRLGQDIRTVSYNWDSQNQLSLITHHSSDRPSFLPQTPDNTLSFIYDDYGNRVKKLARGEATYYINDGLRVLNELDNLGNVDKSIVVGLEQIAEIDDQGEITFVHTDALGSTVLLTDETGGVVAEYEYDVFGSIIGHDGSEDSNYLFTGQEFDPESELYYYNARYYNPKIGRFISRDNFMGRTGDVVSKNRYVYVKNNPLKYVDPTGNDAEKSWLANISSAVRHFSSGNPLLSYAIEQAAEEVTRWALENPLDAAEIGVGSTPIGGEGLDIIEAVSGKELFTGNQLSEFERVLTGGSTFVPFVGGALVRKGVKNVILYHGTTYNRARKILGSGFKTSQRVYMSTEIDTALEFGMEKVSSVVGAGKGAVVKMRVPKEIFDELMRQGHIVERPIEFFGGGRMETVITPQATKVLNQLKNSANSGVEYIISNLIH